MKRIIEKSEQLKQREQDAYDIIAHGTNNAQAKLKMELEKEDLSENEIENALELNRQKELRKALNINATDSLYEQTADLQEFGAMIERKNIIDHVDIDEKLSKSDRLKLITNVKFSKR